MGHPMRLKKFIFYPFLTISAFALCACGTDTVSVSADAEAGETSVERTLSVTYETEDDAEEREGLFPDSWGNMFNLEKTEYEVIDVTEPPVIETEVQKTVYSGVLYDDETEELAKEIVEDGTTYTLTSITPTEAFTGYDQAVSAYTDYSYAVTASSVPQTKTVSTVNERTGETEQVECSLTGIEVLDPVLDETYIDIVFEEYDADTFVWGNLLVPKNEDRPELDSSALLAAEGITDGYVTDIYWTGGAYESGGVLYRNARADVIRSLTRYRALYEGEIETPGTIYEYTYTGTKVTEAEGNPIYEIQATAYYGRNNAVIAVGIGIVALAVVIVAVLLILQRKRGVKDK